VNLRLALGGWGKESGGVSTVGRILGSVVALMLAAGAGWAAGFTRVDPVSAGIRFTNRIAPERYLTNQIPLNGSGVALGDVDGDGRVDLVLGGLDGAGGLFLNLGGWQFTNVTTGSGLEWGGTDVTGVTLVDLDGDGSLDLVMNTLGRGTWLWSNDGRGRFTRRAVVNGGRAGMSLGVADFDGDGDLDLYVVNYRTASIRDDPTARFSVRDDGQGPRVVQYNGRPTTDEDLAGRFFLAGGTVRENGEPDLLLLNEGGWKFRPVSWSDGTFLDEDGRPWAGAPLDWGLSVLARDLTGDGLPDLYVCNDFESPDRFWINRTVPGGPLRFQAVSMLALRNTSAFSMGVDAADVDRDGHVDFVVLDMLSRDHRLRNLQVSGLPPGMAAVGVFEDRPQFSRNTLFRGRGDGTFAEVGRLAGLGASEWSWTPIFLDVDLDGFEDLLVSNGHEMDMMDIDVSDAAEAMKGKRRMSAREQLDLRRNFRRLNPPNAAFRNRGGLRFEDVSKAWGFDAEEVGIGMAAGDLDGDGDLDLVVNNLNSAPTLYRNEATAPRVWVRLKGDRSNTRGIGARIRVTGGPVEQSQEIIAGGRYLSSDDAMRVFAAGTAERLTVEVTWRSGKRTVMREVEPGRVCEVMESAAVKVADEERAVAVWMEDVSDRVRFAHGENVWDDFARQPLLPRNLSQAGPGLTWGDLNGDGHDDLVVGAGQGALPGVFLGDGRGGFQRWFDAPFNRPSGRDMTTLLPLGPVLLAGSSNYEDGLTNGGCIRVFDLSRKVSGEAVLGQGVTAGALAAADADGDGSMEIVVAGRALPGGYPGASDTLLLRSAGGRLMPVQRWNDVGLVNDALWVDLDGDGVSELVLAVEWGPVRILAREGTRWVDRTEGWGLAGLTGWWQGVATGDFDGDGRADLMVGNWGLNVFPGVAEGALPYRVWFGDLDGSGTVDVLQGYTGAGGVDLPVRKFGSVSAALPSVQERMGSHGKYGAATLAEIHGDSLKGLPMREVRELRSVVLLNRGGKFEMRPLPLEAQMSPVFGIAVADFDGDGRDDAVLGQNFFPMHPEEGRQDAGLGLMLRGVAGGGFVAVSPAESGVRVAGEARGAAVADFDGDGRPDVAVAQNGAGLKLFRNLKGRPGIRVRLAGPEGNPSGAGAQLRLKTAEGWGPLRTITMGGGYWSCPSSTVVMTCVGEATGIEVRWPGGRRTETMISSGAKSVVVDVEGKLRVLP